MASQRLGRFLRVPLLVERPRLISQPEGILLARPNFMPRRSLTLETHCHQAFTGKRSLMQFGKFEREPRIVYFGRRCFTAVSKSESSGNSSEEDGGGSFYFDTHKLVTTLQSRGFTLEQAEAITTSLTQVVGRGAAALSKYMVSRNELAQLEIRMNATVEALRKDMVILEKSEFLMLKHENESLKAEVMHLSRLLKDELLKLKSGLTLDLSLEKGRTKEESSIHEQKIKDANNRIETEIARVRMDMEAQKLDLIKYLVGSFLSIVTVLIGWWRFVKS